VEDFKAAMLYLSGLDDDRATERNDRGFNGPDTRRMNRYAGYLRSGRALYPESYTDARQRLQKYSKQVMKGCGVDVTTLPDEMPTAGRERSAVATKPGRCSACGQPFPAGEMVDFERRSDGTFGRSHAGGLCPQRVAPEQHESTPAAVSYRYDNTDKTPWKDQPARTYEQVFNDENPGRALTPVAIVAKTLGTVATPVQTTTGLTVRGILGPGGTIAAMLPGYESRPSQLSVAEAMERAMADGGHLVAEAGTGVGKSLAYLVPAINSGKRTLVSTADKALQGQIWCVAPETRILTADLRYVPAGSITVGQALVGFDEERDGTRRRFRDSKVTAVRRIKRPSYRLKFDDGTEVICSEDHQWLCGRSTNGIRWLTTQQMVAAAGSRQGSPVVRLCDMWESDYSYEAGYLSAAFDGEGWLSQDHTGDNGYSNKLAFSQNDNQMLSKVRELLADAGFDIRERREAVNGVFNTRLHIRTRQEMLRFLGTYRPERLLAKLNLEMLGTIPVRSDGETRHVRLVEKEYIGITDVISITTTTRTYIAEGLASHNCKDIPFLQSVYKTLGRTVRAALLKGRSNYACKFKVNEIRGSLIPDFRSPEAGMAWSDVSTWIDQQDKAGDVADLEMFPGELPGDLRTDITSDADSCIGKRCPAYATCFVEEAKRRAEDADIVVINHALLMRHLSIKAASDGYVTVIPDGNQIVLDEAHHLEDVATDAFGIQITAARWNRLYARLERMTVKHSGATKEAAEVWIIRADAVSAALDTMLETFKRRLVESKEAVQRLGDDGKIIFPTWQALSGLAEDLRLAPSWLAGDEAERDMWNKLQKQTQKLAEDVQAANARELDSEYVRYLELEPTRGNRLVINVKPIDVAEQLRTMLFDATRTVISTSATISTGGSMAYWRERVGCDEATEIEVGSPFDYPKNAMLYLPEQELAKKLDSSAARGRDGMAHYTDTLVEQVRQIIANTTGGVFVLFTSYRMLREVYDRVAPQLDGLVIRQGDANRGRLVERFKAAHAEGIRATLFGTKSFSEGVDIQGDALSVVIVDKFVFVPPGDPIWEGRKDKITRDSGNEWAFFGKLAVPYATIALKQAVGRLIRTQTDRGVVAILEGRATTKRYGSGIINALPPFRRTTSLSDVRSFFSYK
jgi:ATP-dependent DNA helicase DinG